MSAAHESLQAALDALDRPVTRDVALSTARGILPRNEFAQFEAWFKSNGATLLEALNG